MLRGRYAGQYCLSGTRTDAACDVLGFALMPGLWRNGDKRVWDCCYTIWRSP